jgi:hypothetical protein
MRRLTVHVEIKAWNNAASLPCEAKAWTMTRSVFTNGKALFLRVILCHRITLTEDFFVGGECMDAGSRRKYSLNDGYNTNISMLVPVEQHYLRTRPAVPCRLFPQA